MDNIYYTAAAGADKIVTAGPAILERIIVGADVGTSVIEVSDSATDGDGNVKIYLAGNTLQGVYDVGAIFRKGITSDISNQTHVTFIWRPTSV